MKNDVLVIIGSPKGKGGNSESLADYLIRELDKNNVTTKKLFLTSEMKKAETLVQEINQSKLIVLSFPVYENAVPGLVLEFFEMIVANRDKISNRERKMLAISNSGFPEPEANNCAISQCKLFAEALFFTWIGGMAVAPGTLIDGKELQNAGNSYKHVRRIMSLIAEKIGRDEPITCMDCEMPLKSLMSPFIYRTVGRLIQKGNIKKLGKAKFFAAPMV